MPLSQIYFIIIAVSSYLLLRQMNEPLQLQYLNIFLFRPGSGCFKFFYILQYEHGVCVCVCVSWEKKRGKEI